MAHTKRRNERQSPRDSAERFLKPSHVKPQPAQINSYTVVIFLNT